MIYQRYFKPGQKVQLRAKNPAPPEGRNELLSANLIGGNANYFDLRLPYGASAVDQYPFREDMPFELSADALGLGVKVTVTFLNKLSGEMLRVLVLPDLQMFQRRTQPRLDCTLGIRFTRSKNSLQKLRETWEKNATILLSSKKTAPLDGFQPCKINLSAAGIRFSLQAPAQMSDICLMLLDLEDQKPPICALAEVVWTTEPDNENTVRAGMQFLDILEQDKKRIGQFITQNS